MSIKPLTAEELGPLPIDISALQSLPAFSSGTETPVDNRALLNATERAINPDYYTSVEGSARVAANGDTISRMVGSSDPQAIGNFMRANGLTDSRIRAGNNYFIPSDIDAYGASDHLGRRTLHADNARQVGLANSQSNGKVFSADDLQLMNRMFNKNVNGNGGGSSVALQSMRLGGLKPSPFGADPYYGPVDVRGGSESLRSVRQVPVDISTDPTKISRATAMAMRYAPVGIQNYNQSDITFHKYELDTALCQRTQPFCTIPLVSPLVDYSSAPKIGWTGFEKLEKGPQNLIGGDPIIHYSDYATGKFINQTESGHLFHSGIVESTLYWKGDALHLKTLGYGYGKSSIHTEANYAVGVGYFSFWQQSVKVQIQGVNSTLVALEQREK